MKASFVTMNGHKPSNPNDPLELSFDKVFPQSAERNEIRDLQESLYSGTRKHCYVCLSVVIGVLLSFVWGIVMAASEFSLVWFLYPGLKIMKLFSYPVAQLIGVLTNAIYGDCLSNIASKQIFYGYRYKKEDDPSHNHNQSLMEYAAPISEPGNTVTSAPDAPLTTTRAGDPPV